MPILEMPIARDGFNRLRQQNLVDVANDAGNLSAAGLAQTVPTGRGRGIIVDTQPTLHLPVWIIVAAEAPGSGYYYGRLLDDPTILPTGEIDLTAADIGFDPDADNDVLIMNAAEADQGTHDLTTAPVNLKIFPGELLGVNRNDLFVVRIWAIDLKNCASVAR